MQSSYCLRIGAHSRHANSLQTSAIYFSPEPHKPIVLERQAWPPLSLALPFSSSLFDSEEESGRRRRKRAVEGASTISPSLPVLNSLMKFRSEEQWCKQPYSGCYTHLPVCLNVVIYLSISLSVSQPKLGLRNLVSAIAYALLSCAT